jgi:hypothetical protein
MDGQSHRGCAIKIKGNQNDGFYEYVFFISQGEKGRRIFTRLQKVPDGAQEESP